MKTVYNILIKKMYIFALLLSGYYYLTSLMPEELPYFLPFAFHAFWIILPAVLYLIFLPIAFKESTIHSLGHFCTFEIAVFIALGSAFSDGMASHSPFIIFSFYAAVVLIGMLELSIAGHNRRRLENTQQDNSDEISAVSQDAVDS